MSCNAPRTSWPSRLAPPRVLAPAALVAALGLATPAHAQETCGGDAGGLPPDFGALRDFFPGSADRNVPVDAFVRLRYVGRVPRPLVATLREVRTDAPVAVRVALLEDEVHLFPEAELSPGAEYEVRASDLSAGAGGTSYRFSTGPQRITGAAPRFDGLTDLAFVRSGASDRCGDPNAVQVTATWRRALSNGWPDVDLEYLVFQTAGPDLRGPVLRASTRGGAGALSCSGSADVQCTTFRLASENATGRVCFSVQVFDPSGRSTPSAVERCVDPQVGNYFYGCATRPEVGSGAPSRALALTLSAALAAALVARRRRALRR